MRIQSEYTVLSLKCKGCVLSHMGDPFTFRPKGNVEDELDKRHRTTGDSKAKIVNGALQDHWFNEQEENNQSQTLFESFYTNFGIAMFVAGGVVGALQAVSVGVGMLFFGLLLMLYGGAIQNKRVHDVSRIKAVKMTLGL